MKTSIDSVLYVMNFWNEPRLGGAKRVKWLLAFLLFPLVVCAQASLKDTRFQLSLKPLVNLGDGKPSWGFALGPSFKLEQSGNSSHYLGLEISYTSSEESEILLGHQLNHEQKEWLFLVNYTWYMPPLAGGHVQPYLTGGMGSTIVHFESDSPTLGALVDDTDGFSATVAVGLGTEILFNENFGLSLGYRFHSVFDTVISGVTDDLYRHRLHLGAVVGF